ncbi:hypothetical protein LTR37_005301 [Vermiconidia calcicola]|uniref:Uncharacterized protein n=1 Tax=Vermiconidia calcicola TaxID=1690605 RepID=A0ACC3NLD7_9PEZI|nr:hypothetical protein LTR37_005301 [Vermiconidia calcicola]
MGVDISRPSREYTELYLPADTFRQCSPERCWCQGGHRNTRYMYIERGGDGRERYHDPLDYMDRIATGGGWPGSWKHPRDWTTKDYDRLGTIMQELYHRQRGKQMGGIMSPWMMADELGGGGRCGSGMASPTYGRRGHAMPMPMPVHDGPTWEDLERVYGARLKDLQDKVYGSEENAREERWRAKQFNLWKEFMGAYGGGAGAGAGGMGMGAMGAMNGLQGMQMPPMNPNMGMGMGQGMGQGMGPGMMPQQFGGGMTMPPGMGGGFGGMPPMNNAMPNMPGGGFGQMNGFGGDEMFGGGPGGGAFGGRRGGGGFGRNRRFGGGRGIGWDDQYDEGFGAGGGFGGGGGRGFGGRRRGRFGDEDDIFGGLGDGPRSPRGPARGPQRGPLRPDGRPGGGGGGGVGGAFFEDDMDIEPAKDFRRRFPSPIASPRRALRDDILAPPVERQPIITRANDPVVTEPESRRSPLPDPREARMTNGFGAQPPQPPPGGFRADDYGPPYNMGMGMGGGLQMPAGPQYGVPGPSNLRPGMGGMGRHVSFEPGARSEGGDLARPRSEEERRGEAEAGGMTGVRDISRS